MSQPDLFLSPVAPRCGNCVVWNGLSTSSHGGCSVHGLRGADEEPCDRWFGREQLSAGLYGRSR